MQSRKMILPILVVLALGLTPFAFGQFAKTQSPFQAPHRELGYYDRATGAFTPLHAPAEDVLPEATTPTTGEFEFDITITVKDTIPKNTVFGCDARVTVTDVTSTLNYSEEGSAVATGTGTTRTCTIKIFYSWLLLSPTLDSVTLSYDASMIEGYEATATNGSASIVEAVPLRNTGHDLTTIKTPANGATTTETISATL